MSSQTNYKEKHAGRKRDLFPIVCIVIACVPLLFICSAILTIIAGGVTHVGEAVTSAEVLFSLRMSVVTSTISTTLCLLLALPTAYALTRTSMPFNIILISVFKNPFVFFELILPWIKTWNMVSYVLIKMP